MAVPAGCSTAHNDGLRWLSTRDAQRMLWDLIGGRLPQFTTPPVDERLVQLASVPANRLRTRAANVAVEIGDTEVLDSHGYLPTTFWNPYAVKCWRHSSDWNLGIVAGLTSPNGQEMRAIAYGVMFCRDDLERLVGTSTPDQTNERMSSPKVAAVAESSDRPIGGRPSDKHGEPIATVTIKLLRISDAELQRYNGESLGLELGYAYKAIGAASPSGKNLEGIAWGILRAVRASRIVGV